MIEVNFKPHFDQAMRDLRHLRDDIINKAGAMAMNKTVAKGRTEMVRAITSEFAVRSTDVRSRLHIIKAKRDGLDLVAILDAFTSTGRKGRSLNLIHFLESKVSMAEARRRERGGTQNLLRFRIKKAGPMKPITGAFVGNRGRTVFARTGPGRTPIRPVQTIGIPQMFNTTRINARVIKRIKEAFPVEFQRALDLLLARYNSE